MCQRAVGQRPLRVTMPADHDPQGISTFDCIDTHSNVPVPTNQACQHRLDVGHDISLFLVWWR